LRGEGTVKGIGGAHAWRLTAAMSWRTALSACVCIPITLVTIFSSCSCAAPTILFHRSGVDTNTEHQVARAVSLSPTRSRLIRGHASAALHPPL